MILLPQVIYNYVSANPGEKGSAIAKALDECCQRNKWSSNSIQAYLSLMKKAELLKVMPSNPDGTGVHTFYVHRKFDQRLLTKILPGAGNRRGIPRALKPRTRPNRLDDAQLTTPEMMCRVRMRSMLDQYGPTEVIAALQHQLFIYGRDNAAWVESMTEDVTDLFEGAFDVIHQTMKVAK